MKNICFILFLTILGFAAQAQNNATGNNGKISGKVNDASNNTPVDYATISVFKTGSTSPFNGGVTDPKGNFKIDNIPT
jgi:ferric enterobactin receptor